ncbi:hypothetical protein ECN1_1358 [Escherichia coli N1]|nr:hypothetical protein ECN1_1358 [Escherichia coli N1]
MIVSDAENVIRSVVQFLSIIKFFSPLPGFQSFITFLP